MSIPLRQFFDVERHRGSARLALGLVALLGLGGTARGQDRVGFDFDDPPETIHPITPDLSYGAALELDFIHQEGFDLGLGNDVDRTELEPKGELAFTYEPNATLRAFLDLELSRVFVLDSPNGSQTEDIKLEAKEAYVTLRKVVGDLTLQIGRQSFQDEIEWYYDQELDGARAYYRLGTLAVEGSVSREGLAPVDLLNSADVEDVNNLFLVGHSVLGEESLASSYLLFRDGREADTDDLYFLGLQSAGELAPELDYWVNAAYVGGEGADSEGAPGIRGFGIDAMGTYVADLPLEPALSLGFAYGSGDNDPGDGGDHNFRQTGLQENEAELNGVVPIKYYGELFDPELSNLTILTVGAGLRPSEDTSIDFVYHHYRQNKASDELRSSNLAADPDGQNKDLGQELDIVFGAEDVGGLTAQVVFGAFFPGDAFGSNADPAYFAGFELQFAF